MDEVNLDDDVHQKGFRPNADDCLIDINCITAKCPSSADEKENNTLTDVSITVDSGQLLTIVGHVGAGKVQFKLKPIKKFRLIIVIISINFARVPY